MKISSLKLKKPGGFSVSGNDWPRSEVNVMEQMLPEWNVLVQSCCKMEAVLRDSSFLCSYGS